MAIKVLIGTPANGGSSGDMTKAVYDPRNINADAFDRANHTGTQSISTITGLQAEIDSLAVKGVLTQSGGNVTGSINTINNTFTLNTSGGGGGSVNSVTGDGVDNADPSNPVLSFPTPSDIGLGNVQVDLTDLDSRVTTNEGDISIAQSAADTAVLLAIDAQTTADSKLQSGDNISELINDANYVNSNQLNTKTNKALTQELINSTPKVIASTDSDKTFNVFGVGALCVFQINTGALNIGEAFEINIGDSDGVDVVAGAGVNIFGNVTGSTTVGDSILVRRIPDNSFGLTGEVYKVY